MVVFKNEVTHAWDLKFISNQKSQNQVSLNLSVNEVVLSAFVDKNGLLLEHDGLWETSVLCLGLGVN